MGSNRSGPSGPSDAAGQLFGPYRVIELLGRGGMGEVYLAERADGEYTQQVAIKTLRCGLPTEQMEARFRAERQILALLEHPDIARLLDGSVDEQGRPYLVMELVEGEPITTACDAARLSVEQRLALFARVCDAVQYAHANLIVHRDLKPSNIVVDGAGNPKLLDFGVAKLLDATSRDLVTPMPETAWQRPALTPEYASPEQVLGLPVNTSCDVYALGLLLHELLCGERARKIRASSWSELQRAICDEPLTAPSTSVRALSAGVQVQLARQRQLRDKQTWARRLSGELDLIVANATHRDPERRYASARELADDVRRHLANQPLRAHPDRPVYRLRKLFKRRPAAVASAVAVVASLAVAAVGLSVGLLRARDAEQVARQEAEVASETTEFLVDLFSAPDPAQARGEEVSARQLLERGAERVRTELEGSPASRLRLLGSITHAYRGLGLLDDARALGEETVEAARATYGEGSLQLGRAQVALAQVVSMTGELELSRDLAQEGITSLERGGAEAMELAMATGQLGRAYGQLRQLDEAAEVLARSIALLDGRSESWVPMTNLGAVHLAAGDYAKALEVLEQARVRAGRAFDDEHPAVLNIDANVAQALDRLGRSVDALAINLDVVERRERLLPPTHPRLAASYNSVVTNYLGLGLAREAIPFAEKALAIRQEALPPGHPHLATSLHNLGEVYFELGRTSDALDCYREELEVLEPLPEQWAPRRMDALVGMSRALRALGKPDQARAPARRALTILREVGAGEDAGLREIEAELSELLAD